MSRLALTARSRGSKTICRRTGKEMEQLWGILYANFFLSELQKVICKKYARNFLISECQSAKNCINYNRRLIFPELDRFMRLLSCN